MTDPTQFEPKPRYYLEKIGEQEHQLEEASFDVFDQLCLWNENPRLIPHRGAELPNNEDEMEAMLQASKGYDGLRKSIEDLGQLEPIYVWRRGPSQSKFLVIEGATRVAVLRDLQRKFKGRPEADRYLSASAKVLPEDFSKKEIVVLLAGIHVRGTAVRNWGRFVQAKFIYDHVTGDLPLLTLTEMANQMGKSASWASRLRDAYKFADQFVEWEDSEDAEKLAIRHFSTLEEISKATDFGPRVRADSGEGEQLREDVFKMVKHDVFKEYRDARFMAKYLEDKTKWDQLLELEKHSANHIANQLRAGETGAKGKIQALYGQIERSLDKGESEFEQEDIEELQRCVDLLASKAADIGPFRLRMNQFANALFSAPLADVSSITPDEYRRLEAGLEDLKLRLDRHTPLVRKQWPLLS